MLLPGPEAMQLATYAGWTLHGTGGLAAGLLFVLPGAIVILALSMLYARLWAVSLGRGAFFRDQSGGFRHRCRSLDAGRAPRAQAAIGLVDRRRSPSSHFMSSMPPSRWSSRWPGSSVTFEPAPSSRKATAAPIDWRGTLATVSLWLAIWLVPVALLLLAFGHEHVFAAVALFFSKLAVVTFGGAYAVLAYMAQEAVVVYGWLNPREMVDGLGLAETTPGPLILVTEFVGYLAGHRLAGGLWGGIAGAVITLWVTFTPCFLWIFAAAPYVERLAGLPRVAGALAAITAAVVGVILNLSLWFAIHVLFAKLAAWRSDLPPWDFPNFSTRPWSLLLSLLAAWRCCGFTWGSCRPSLSPRRQAWRQVARLIRRGCGELQMA